MPHRIEIAMKYTCEDGESIESKWLAIDDCDPDESFSYRIGRFIAYCFMAADFHQQESNEQVLEGFAVALGFEDRIQPPPDKPQTA